ncbi:MAG TPA: zinc dependent phospholipase C family protein [Candidatus Nanoarchaeia archaeon]|nr:zinc dependent phospholipase C family protein [Candidatus Nanoarchaeia archaeon]
MNWLIHILVGLLFYNGKLDLTWFLIGNIFLDFFFIFSFLKVAGFKPRTLKGMLKFESKAIQTWFHQIGWFAHGFPAVILFGILSFFVGFKAKSFLLGLIAHDLVDFITHKDEPKPLWLPFSKKYNNIGLFNGAMTNPKAVVFTVIVLLVLLFLKYKIYGFVV